VIVLWGVFLGPVLDCRFYHWFSGGFCGDFRLIRMLVAFFCCRIYYIIIIIIIIILYWLEVLEGFCSGGAYSRS
jgi:hypothetical protein